MGRRQGFEAKDLSAGMVTLSCQSHVMIVGLGEACPMGEGMLLIEERGRR